MSYTAWRGKMSISLRKTTSTAGVIGFFRAILRREVFSIRKTSGKKNLFVFETRLKKIGMIPLRLCGVRSLAEKLFMGTAQARRGIRFSSGPRSILHCSPGLQKSIRKRLGSLRWGRIFLLYLRQWRAQKPTIFIFFRGDLPMRFSKRRKNGD